MSIGDYTPCRKMEFFCDEREEITIANSTDAFRLRGIGRTIWYLLDGKHTINQITEQLCRNLSLCEDSNEEMQRELVVLLNMLHKRDAIIINWDPLYKLTLSQELF